MAKKTNAPVCDRCETSFRSASPFCPACGGPTPWTSHEERVQWEVRQWRANRASTERDKPQMMLVRTEAGYEPMAVARYNEYVWDQPLHSERAAEPESLPEAVEVARAPMHAPRPEPVTPVVERPIQHPQTAHGNGNGVHEAAANRPEPPEPDPAAALVAPEPEPPQVQTYDQPGTHTSRAGPAGSLLGPAEDRVTISKKAVAVGIALVIGLPFGGKIIGLASRDADGAPRKAVTASQPRPAALVAARSGFEQLGPDAVRYAVVVHNPNKTMQASGVTISLVVHDSRGRLVGTGTERISAVPAAGASGVAGAVGVSGPAAKMTVKVGTSSFRETAPARPFIVRGVRLSRRDGQFVVRADLSGVQAVKGARVVAVHLDRSGRVVGGDFTYVDVPRRPEFVRAVIPTSGVRRTVVRVEVYVLPR